MGLYLSVCAGKVVILSNCMNDVIHVAMLHVFYRPLSTPYVIPLEMWHHLVSGKTVGFLTYHFLSIFWQVLLGQQNHSHLYFFCPPYDEDCAFICSLEDTHEGRERQHNDAQTPVSTLSWIQLEQMHLLSLVSS